MKASKFICRKALLYLVLLSLLCIVSLVYVTKFWYRDQHIYDGDDFLLSLPKNISTLPIPSEEVCKCKKRNLPIVNDTRFVSTCDEYATRRGKHQKVVSYSLYGRDTSRYMNGISINVKNFQVFYEGWVMRVYHSVDTSIPDNLYQLCKLWCENPMLDFCLVGRLPEPLGDVSKSNGMVWRFLVLGDPLVDQFVLRDIDNYLSSRELDAVTEWIHSGKTWHFMRDHPQHERIIMGGMWGGYNRNLTITSELQRKLLKNSIGRYAYNNDQDLLEKYLWPIAKNDFISHDSYNCMNFTSQPWPSRRIGYKYVGASVVSSDLNGPCPERCRPKGHLDWTYC